MDRLQELYKIAAESISEEEYVKLSFVLSTAHGWDSIDGTLLKYGYERGLKFGKGLYFLNKNGVPLKNAYLEGSHEDMKVVLGDAPESPERDAKRKIPYDAYFSPSALYEQEERDREHEE